MTNYKKGNIVKGCVTGIEKYGIFVSLDNYYGGLIHISEISDSFVKNIKDYVNIGETIDVKILEVNDKENQVKLSIRGFDYRIEKPHQIQSKIIEVGTGFEGLNKKRKEWIDEKIIK